MKKIKLTRGKTTRVSDADFSLVSRFQWYALKGKRTFYAARSITGPAGKRTTQCMHQLILATCGRVDHKDHDGLNNQRHNLRPATPSNNGGNSRKPLGQFTSRFKGVFWNQGKWEAQIRCQRRQIYLGRFTSEEDAARAYDTAAKKYFVEFALTNAGLGLFTAQTKR